MAHETLQKPSSSTDQGGDNALSTVGKGSGSIGRLLGGRSGTRRSNSACVSAGGSAGAEGSACACAWGARYSGCRGSGGLCDTVGTVPDHSINFGSQEFEDSRQNKGGMGLRGRGKNSPVVAVWLTCAGCYLVVMVILIAVRCSGRGRGSHSESSGSRDHGGLWDAVGAVPLISVRNLLL